MENEILLIDKVCNQLKTNVNARGSIKAAKRSIMGYSMQLERDTVQVENEFFSPRLLESRIVFEDEIMSTQLADVSLNHFHLIHGKQSARKDVTLLLHFDTSFYMTHFVLNNKVHNSKHGVLTKNINTYSTYFQDKDQPELGFICKGQEYEFFELALRKSFLQEMIEDDYPHSEKIYNQFNISRYAHATRYPMRPAMSQCINDLNNHSFTGSLKQLFLETKASEIFLLQVRALTNSPEVISKLKPREIEGLHEARLFIEQNFQKPCSIVELARIVGINQTKLKSGFKEIFGTTIFGYVRDLQMEKARQLLLEQKLPINNVANQVGYKHPQHFAAAFKRKFGVLPSELKR